MVLRQQLQKERTPMRYSIAMAMLLTRTLETIEPVETELKPLLEPLWNRLLALVGEFFAGGGFAHERAGVRAAAAARGPRAAAADRRVDLQSPQPGASRRRAA